MLCVRYETHLMLVLYKNKYIQTLKKNQTLTLLQYETKACKSAKLTNLNDPLNLCVNPA